MKSSSNLDKMKAIKSVNYKKIQEVDQEEDDE